MVVAILKTLSRDQNRKIIIYRIWFVICTGKQVNFIVLYNQSRTNGPINAHLTIAQVMPRYSHNNEKQEALL